MNASIKKAAISLNVVNLGFFMFDLYSNVALSDIEDQKKKKSRRRVI